MAPMRPREAPTRPPDGSLTANMTPQDAPRSLPGYTREACVFLAPRGGLAELVSNQEWCVLHMFYKLFFGFPKTPARHLDGSQMAPMRPREAITRPPDGSQITHMSPQDVPGSLQVTFVRPVYSWRLVVGSQSLSQIKNRVFY